MPGDGGPEFVFLVFPFLQKTKPRDQGPSDLFPKSRRCGEEALTLGSWPPAVAASKAGTSTQHHAFMMPT